MWSISDGLRSCFEDGRDWICQARSRRASHESTAWESVCPAPYLAACALLAFCCIFSIRSRAKDFLMFSVNACKGARSNADNTRTADQTIERCS